MPLLADLVARAVGRSVGSGGRALVLGLAREAHRQYRRAATAPPERVQPPPAPSGPSVGAAYALWLVGIAAFVLVVLNVHLFLPDGGPVAVFRIATGAVLLVEGLALLVERLPFRRLLRARLASRSRRFRARLVGAILTVLGLAWTAAGVLNVLRGAVDLP